jgi:hypothetical protein
MGDHNLLREIIQKLVLEMDSEKDIIFDEKHAILDSEAMREIRRIDRHAVPYLIEILKTWDPKQQIKAIKARL